MERREKKKVLVYCLSCYVVSCAIYRVIKVQDIMFKEQRFEFINIPDCVRYNIMQ